MNLDLAPLANVLLSLMSAAVMAAIPILVPAVLKRLKIANDADLNQKLTTALDAAAGLAYKIASEHEGGLSSVPVQNLAVGSAANYVLTQLPDTVNALGITPASIQAMVTARLGTLMAADPNISVTPAALPVLSAGTTETTLSAAAPAPPPAPVALPAAAASSQPAPAPMPAPAQPGA